jgi:hypothetical protein
MTRTQTNPREERNIFGILIFDQRKRQTKDTKQKILLVFTFLGTSTVRNHN